MAGALCVLRFSNTICRGSVAATNITLNINSSGAKNVVYDMGVAPQSYGTNPYRRGLVTVTIRHEIPSLAWYIYSGSEYMTALIETHAYSDYSDYSD